MELREIQCMGPFPIYALTTFTLNVCSNQHGKVSLTGTIEKQYEKSVITCKDDAVKFIIKDKAGEEKILFCGVIHTIELKHMKDVCVLTMEVMSHTIQLDKQKKRRSFQDQNLSYETLLKNIVQKEYQGDLLDSLTQGKKIESFLLQYDETDWEFFKRIISRLNGVLFPEICAQSPKIYVGLPNPGEKSIDITHDKTLSLDLTQSAWTKANEQRGTELDHIKQRIRSQSEYPLGTNLIYEGKPFTITEQTIHGDIQVQGGYLERTYTLQPRGGCYINHYYQENDTGLHLQGKVLEVDQDRFRVHLDIDEKQDPNTAYWFPIHSDYVANQHTGQYIMPEKGSVVYLYFPNRKEEEASIRAVRRIDGETNAKTQDPDTKYISNATGKHWKMDKRSLNIVIEEGHFFIEQDASKGIQIKSNQAIQITSEQDIQFQAPSVHLTAKEEISLEVKGSSLILDNETHFKSSKVSELGIPVPVVYQERVIPKSSGAVQEIEENSPAATKVISDKERKKEQKKQAIDQLTQEKRKLALQGSTKTATYRRVQGGIPPNASRKRIIVREDGKVHIPDKVANLNVSTRDDSHAQYFLKIRGETAEIVEFEIPEWLDQLIADHAIKQKGYNQNPANAGGTAPKIVDPTTPGLSYELPAPWIEWMEQYGTKGRVVKN